ncbi:restriction endonuclease subunit S [Serratia fonticola]|uniref:restriction endonuclease subunit S n=1 Tax=Serratia fonticola TaxID=47917 RepID=UPI003AAEDE68
MSVDNKVPEIRFKAFSGAWEPKTLGDIISYIKGFAFKSNDYETYGIRIVRVSDLTRNSLSESSNKIHISCSKANLYSGYTINAGDIVITTVGSKAEMRESAVGRAIIFTKSEGYLLNQNLVKVTPTLGNDSQFIYSQLLRERYTKFIEDIQRGNANQANITIGDLWEYSLSCPKDKKEQTQIGNYFQKLDELINQHQNKHDKLNNLKKAMLEKMFPKQGETTPEIRFKGFSGKWDEKVLGDMMTVTSVKRILQSDWTLSGVRFLRARDIVSAYKNEAPSDYLYIAREKYNEYSQLSGKVEVGDLLVTGVGTIGVPMSITNDEPVYFKDGNIIWFKNENNIDGMFFFYSFIGDLIQTHIKHSAGTGTVGTYTINSGKNTPIKLPTREEQAVIGNYFQRLDTLINQHQQQITKLKNIKQACLSKMFV